ncbi:NHL domain-containing protein [Actinoplanes derwentensis]|uniref:NHL repeat-containing protein n=1 Tax=Actinoplanes derwentensis TaxID=113562 RepID=A0A1H2CAF3_9ACTN|nr:hypothetical protein [Actinoplanes derwentensis]SDT67411.1 NHL repeat-containing protein [Actinoplanes derwentensis]
MSPRVAVLAVLTASVFAAPMPAFARAVEAAPSLVAGGKGATFAGDGGSAAEAGLNRPLGAAVAADGTVYIADTRNHRVRAVGVDGVIRTVAGNDGQTASTGPVPAGAKGTDVSLGLPNTLAVGADGTLFIADSLASRVYALAADGTIEARVTAESLGSPIVTINSLAVTPSGTLYLADRENGRIVEVRPGDDARPLSTPASLPIGLAADAAGDVWITSATSQLSRLHDGKLATIVESAGSGWAADENRPTSAPFNATAVSAGKDGVYFVDNRQRTVRRLGTDGTVTTAVALTTDPFGARDPVGLATSVSAAGPLYLIDTVGSRVFSMPALLPEGNDTGGTERVPALLWIAGAAGVVLVMTLSVMARRRRV